jgi:hypothetical protein
MGLEDHPVNNVQWVPLEKVEANSWNPNAVAKNEMRLLHTSIKEDGYTQPVVTIYDPERDKYVVVDGFHRFTIMRRYEDVWESTGGLLPVVVINKPPAGLMASTVRHNRARGKHSVGGMGTIVFGMLEEGKTDEQICAELGMEADELLRLKHITGFAKLFENVEYRRAWMTRRQIQLRKKYRDEHPEEFGRCDDPADAADLDARSSSKSGSAQVAQGAAGLDGPRAPEPTQPLALNVGTIPEDDDAS